MKKINLLILSLVLSIGGFSQQSWYWYSPYTDSYHLNDIVFNSVNDGWAVGDAGKLIHFNGQKWSMVEKLTWNDLNALCFTDANNGWAVGDGGIILRYRNGIWTPVNSGTTMHLKDVYFTSEENGWAVGEVRLHYTGNEWVTIDTLGYGGLTEVFFLDETHGWSGGMDQFYKFDSTGWHVCPLPIPNSETFSINSIYFTDESHGWIGGYWSDFSFMLLEYDGTEWKMADEHPEVISNGLFFNHPSHGWSCGDLGLYTGRINNIWEFSGGLWSGSYASFNTPNALASLNANDLYVVTRFGHILYHDSQGWQYSNSLAEGNTELSFPDTTNGWAVGEGGAIMHYHSGEWHADTSTSNVYFEHIHFPDSLHGIASGKIVDSSDLYCLFKYSANSWSIVSDTIRSEIMSVHALPNDESWISGLNMSGGSIMKLSGNNLTDTTFTDLFMVSSIDFPDSDHGWAIGKTKNGMNSIILRYQNGQWIQEFVAPANHDLTALSFSDANSGWAVGNMDGSNTGISWYYNGQSWTAGPEASGEFTSVHHPGPDHTFAVGLHDIHTLKNGLWEKEIIPINQNLVSICFPAEGVGWIGGEYGAILSTRSPFPVGTPESSLNSTSWELKLFPNPATHHLKIEIKAPIEPGSASQIPSDVMKSGTAPVVEIFNLFGQIVFLKEIRNKANALEIEVSAWPRGIYVVRLLVNKALVGCSKIVIQ